MMSWIENPGLENWKGLKFSELKVDEAFLNVSSSLEEKLWLYTLSEDCERCPYQRHSIINAGENIIKMSTRRNMKMRISNDGGADYISVSNQSSRICGDITPDFGEFGVYDLTINQESDEQISCNMTTAKECVNIYLPMAAILSGLAILAIVSTFLTYAIKKTIMYCKEKKTSNKVNCEMSDYGGDDRTTQASSKPARHRIKSIDTFRGLAVVLMIFVNDGAGHYWFLEHATWNGILVADFVFPWFLWVMGLCIPISIRTQLKRNVSRWKILGHVIKRGILLFGLGVLLNTVGIGSDLETIRIPGVLQRFSIVYLIIAILGVCFTPRSISNENRFPGSSFRETFQDIIIIFPQWIVILSIVAAYCYFVFFSPVPGCPSGYLGPGGIQDGGRFNECTGGMTGYVDKVLLGVEHIYKNPTSSKVYKSGPFDPEGLLGVMPSIFQAFFGVQAGATLLYHPEWKAKLIRWFTWGILNGILALLLSLPGIVPINKNLWSLSYVFTTTSSAFLILCVIYFFQDHLRFWNGVPFKGPGMNPTILYVGHIITYNLFPFNWSYGNMNTHFILTLENLWTTSLWIIIAYWLGSGMTQNCGKTPTIKYLLACMQAKPLG
ncbi:conserved hypothetical protein [Pediculus humanus corporis]|uniref:Heparan-alpha-glucosaminide N-acetyltransferase catalytic domain-containing protein n=1 Tax=Pediculus humanus subsp. corporis TaxID=121224 RepID=E0VZL6_PEDHC|nr:uncharacterized protein Phum_PHUM535950 [Pediculus humanus corporis]EEB18822.1 conserved hypothetical protein [Pediculus humanus corporis]